MVISGEKIGVGTVTPISKLHVRSAASDVLPPRLEASAADKFRGWVGLLS